MSKNFLQRTLKWFDDTFKDDMSKMLIATGTLGWILSSAAQICGILGNNKISSEQKSFLLPQEAMDALVNVSAFFGITMFAKKYISKMASTGKIAPQSVRNYINNNPLLKEKVGKFDFNLDEALPANSDIKSKYESYKNFVTTMGTIGASVFSCNIVTPVVRNATASRVQKNYIDMKKNPALYQYSNGGNMKV